MAKNKKTMKTEVPGRPLPTEPISPVGKRVIASGAALVTLGFVVLSFADPLGKNAAALVSPFLLLAGYAAIGVGLFLPPAPPASAVSADPGRP